MRISSAAYYLRIVAVAAITASMMLIHNAPVARPQSDEHLTGCSSVDDTSGSALLSYADYTQYDNAVAWAVSVWQDLNVVYISHDQSDPTLEFADADLNGTVFAGIYDSTTYGYYDCVSADSVDDIIFNTDYFDRSAFSSVDARTIAAHEFGHALGIGDHETSAYSNTLMYGFYVSAQ